MTVLTSSSRTTMVFPRSAKKGNVYKRAQCFQNCLKKSLDLAAAIIAAKSAAARAETATVRSGTASAPKWVKAYPVTGGNTARPTLHLEGEKKIGKLK